MPDPDQATFILGPVRVSVPATSANLGPGFDSLGLALDLRDHLEGEVLPAGLDVTVGGEGAGEVPLDESHLVVRAMRVAFEACGVSPSGLRLTCTNVIPHGRGLGSSSAAIVGGLALARALVVDGSSLLDDDRIFELAATLEGHPDNVAPALFGGLVICGHEDGDFYAVASPVDPRIGVVVFIPAESVPTAVTRGLLPTQVPHGDAAAAAGRTALLVAALAGQPDQLFRATRDYLHQEYRRPAMPQSLALVDSLRADGLPALVSGAGPAVLVFSAGPDSDLTEMLLARCPAGWRAHHLAIETEGARPT